MPFKPELAEVLKEVFRGKAISRTLTNLFWRGRIKLSGNNLDIGGGSRGSHYRFLEIENGSSIKIADIMPKKGIDYLLDITKDKIPLNDNSVDFVLMFNILEHLSDHRNALSEVNRILKKDGKLIGTIPFLVNIHPDPEDYVRFTDTALRKIFDENGFIAETIEPIGRGPFLAAYEQLDMLIWTPLHLLFLPLIWVLDGIVSMLKPSINFKAKFPVAYNFIVRKM